MKTLIAIAMSLFLAVSCSKESPKVAPKVTPMVTAKVSSSINLTFDYRDLKSIGVFAFGQSAEVIAIHGDYVKVKASNENEGYVWIGLFDDCVTKGLHNERGFVIGDALICTNRVGASMKDKPSKYGKIVGTVKNDETVIITDIAVTYYRLTAVTENGERTGWVYSSNVIFSYLTNGAIQ